MIRQAFASMCRSSEPSSLKHVLARCIRVWQSNLPAFATPEVPADVLNDSLFAQVDIPPITSLNNQADRVVLGKVLATRTQREPTNIYTVATVRVWETLRGDDDPIVEVHLPGAMLTTHDLSVYGQAQLLPGFEVLLFLQDLITKYFGPRMLWTHFEYHNHFYQQLY